MTQLQCELALIKLGEFAAEIIGKYSQEITHACITINSDGYISVSGAKFEGMNLTENNLLDASKYPDGHIRFGGKEGAA